MMKMAMTVLAAAVLAPVMASAQFSTPVRDVENPARTPFIMTYTCFNSGCSTSETIPAGMRFVIETVTGYLRPASSSEPIVRVEGRLDSTYTYLFVPPLRGGLVNGSLQSLVYCSMVKYYSDYVPVIELPGGSVDNSYSSSVRTVTLIGHLVKK